MKKNKYGENRIKLLESKGTVELIDELNKRIEDDDFDEALVEDYLAVLQEKAPIDTECFDAKDSYRRFKEKYAYEYEAAFSPKPMPRKIKRHFRAAGTIAAAACLIFILLLVPKDAYGNSFLDRIINWGEEVLSIRRLPPGGHMILPADSESEYRSISEALEKNGIPSNNCPTWIPAGFSLTEVFTTNSKSSKNFLAVFQNNDKMIQFIVQYDLSQSVVSLFEKDSATSIYLSKGREYYIMTNVGIPKAIWIDDYATYQISGDISVEDLQLIIDSITERR
ncbi:MAG: DUF4367 domain-containing protein [Clostridiales bacterium]|nr:DUF4367 domain-containing protein [Clostridiales bacterium]